MPQNPTLPPKWPRSGVTFHYTRRCGLAYFPPTTIVFNKIYLPFNFSPRRFIFWHTFGCCAFQMMFECFYVFERFRCKHSEKRIPIWIKNFWFDFDLKRNLLSISLMQCISKEQTVHTSFLAFSSPFVYYLYCIYLFCPLSSHTFASKVNV